MQKRNSWSSQFASFDEVTNWYKLCKWLVWFIASVFYTWENAQLLFMALEGLLSDNTSSYKTGSLNPTQHECLFFSHDYGMDLYFNLFVLS